MNLVLILFLIPYIMAIQTQNGTEEVKSSKTKRTTSNQIRNPGENRPIFIYDDNAASPDTLTGFYAPIAIKPFDVESPKQVAAQQVLYEFQQTPTNAVSNVHVNQFLQPLAQQQAGKQDSSSDFSPITSPQEPLYQQSQPVPINRAPNQYGGQPIASPVHHSAFVRHGQNLAQVNFQPLGSTIPHHIQTQQYIPGKYLYVNGKIIHQPGYNNQQYQQPPHQQYQQFPSLNPALQKPYYNPKHLPQKLMPPPAPTQRFHPPQRHQIQQITKPISPPEVTEEQNEEEPEDENAPVRDGDEAEASEESSDDNSERYEEAEDDDEEKEGFFGRYHFDEDEDDRRKDEDKDRYREESEEDDSDRGSSRYSPKRYQYNKKSKPQKHHKSDKYAYSESYITNSRYGDEKPKKRAGGKKGSSSTPKTHYKAYKFSKNNHGKPRYEKIQGKFSENIPVVQKQKILQEKWYVTSKSSDELH